MTNSLPNNWQIKSLGEVAFITSGQNAPQGSANFSSKGIPFIRAGSLEKLTNGFKDVDLEKIDNENANKLRFKVFPSGCVLFAKSGMSAAKDRVIELKFPAYIVTHLAIAKPNEQLYSSYLAYFLRKYRPSRLIKDFGYPFISLEDVARIQIPLPPLPIQKQIAEILEKADQAKQKRKEANKLTDEFLQSVFIEMFGDPVKNPKGFEKIKTKELFEIKLGKMRSEKSITGKYLKPYLRNVNVQWGRLYLSDIKQMDFNPKEQRIYSLKRGDILVCEGGEVGRTAIWNGEIEDIYYQNALHRLRSKSDKINSTYFLYFMFFAAKYGLILKRTSVVTIAHFTAEKFNEFDIILPPLSLQKQFAEIVNKTEALKEKQKQSEQELENLFQSLMQKAFKGELVA